MGDVGRRVRKWPSPDQGRTALRAIKRQPTRPYIAQWRANSKQLRRHQALASTKTIDFLIDPFTCARNASASVNVLPSRQGGARPANLARRPYLIATAQSLLYGRAAQFDSATPGAERGRLGGRSHSPGPPILRYRFLRRRRGAYLILRRGIDSKPTAGG